LHSRLVMLNGLFIQPRDQKAALDQCSAIPNDYLGN
jgi:hypothetical protein